MKVKGWKKIFHANRDQKKAGVAILISDKIDFKTKAVKRDKEGHYIMIKGSIQEEDITIINIYAPNIGAPQYVRQMLTSMKGEMNNNMYNIIYETSHQSRFDARYWMLKAGALGRPRGMVWGGRREEGSYFCIHSASLCLLVGAFNPFTFKVIIDKYDPVAIYFIVLGLSLYTIFVFPV